MKVNCWEFYGCGRESGGVNAMECGICPASIEKRLDGIHGGKNAGRSCWAVGGTFCEGCVKEDFNEKFHSCRECDFYKTVAHEEGSNFLFSVQLHEILNNNFITGH